jgi:hypothetical protein
MPDTSPLRSMPASVEKALTGLDPLLISIGLAIATCTPGPAGEAGAIAAISYDMTKKKWFGAVLSAASMVPAIGYFPPFLKVGLLLFLLHRRLENLAVMAPDIHRSPETLQLVRSALAKYYYQLPDIPVARLIRKRLAGIMDFDGSGHLPVDPRQDGASVEKSISTQIPK